MVSADQEIETVPAVPQDVQSSEEDSVVVIEPEVQAAPEEVSAAEQEVE